MCFGDERAEFLQEFKEKYTARVVSWLAEQVDPCDDYSDTRLSELLDVYYIDISPEETDDLVSCFPFCDIYRAFYEECWGELDPCLRRELPSCDEWHEGMFGHYVNDDGDIQRLDDCLEYVGVALFMNNLAGEIIEDMRHDLPSTRVKVSEELKEYK